QHDTNDPLEALASVIERTVSRGGTVVIPAFAVGRAQSLIYQLWRLKQAGRLKNVPIYLDSPMATSATELLCRHNVDHKLTADECAAACGAVNYIRDVEESKALSANRYPKVIISASGMATGGRVQHHIAAFGGDHRNTLLFSGFQAAGTRGRKLLEGAREVKIYGHWMPVNAEVTELPMLSAHADSDELMRWLSGFQRPPRRVFIVHGEPEASEALRERIIRGLGWDATVPLQDQVLELYKALGGTSRLAPFHRAGARSCRYSTFLLALDVAETRGLPEGTSTSSSSGSAPCCQYRQIAGTKKEP